MSSKHKLEAGSCVIVKGEVISPRRRNPKKPVHRAAQYHIRTAWEAENPKNCWGQGHTRVRCDVGGRVVTGYASLH